jgi:predicted TIM-barrel fold metal-dependent hydrolase
MLDAERAPLWAAFAHSGLVCNLQVTPPNYGTLIELARRYSNINFLCNHLGLPSAFEPGDATYGGLAPAADLDNIYIKASAFYAAAATPWDFRCPRALGFFSTLLKMFGPTHILWGSDWPPTSRHLTYRQALEIVRTHATDLDDAARALVLGTNAAQLLDI